jgi:hypothetical protein
MEEPTNGHPATRASVVSIDRKVDVLSSQVLTLNNALMGVPGLSDGVIKELRDGNHLLQQQLLSFQTALPNQINAAIDQRNQARTANRVTGVRSWVVAAGSSSFAVVVGVVLNILWLHFGGGATTPIK